MNQAERSKWQNYLRLFRISNVFTAVADVTMGFLFVHQSLAPAIVFVTLAVASAVLYTAGMVLNDVWDVEQDRRERPDRPIASGAISLLTARRLGFLLLASGALIGTMAGCLGQVPGAPFWRSGLIAMLLAVSIVLYDRVLKRGLAGPLAMGSCRFLNVLLGMSVAVPYNGSGAVAGFGPHHLLAAAGIGVYIAGVTWFARKEAAKSNRFVLAVSTTVMVSGVALLALIYRYLPLGLPPSLTSETTWFLLLGLLTFTIVRRCSVAVADPSPSHVQLAVKNALWSLIVLDAAVALLVCHPAWSLVVLALLIPTVVLGQWIKST